MTYGIIETLNLPHISDIIKDDEEIIDDVNLEKALEDLDNVAERKAMIEGTGHTKDMDSLHDEIIQHARDLMAYGFNTDSRGARGIFEVATTMYGHAISAKNSKRDAELKAMKLALDRKKLELDEKKTLYSIGQNNNQVATSDNKGNIVVEDRNDLIKKWRDELNSNQP